MPSFAPVIALSRGLEILRVINEQKAATVRSLHQETGLDKATIVRMLETLEHEGYVMRAKDAPLYTPTGRTLTLSSGYDRHRWFGAVASPILEEYRQKIGWPSDVAIMDRDALVVVETTRAQAGLSFHREAGYRVPILVTSLGRAYLAFCPADEREAILALLKNDPDSFNDLARDRPRLDALLAEVRTNGFGIMDEAYSRRNLMSNMWSIAVPVMRDNTVYAAINMMMLRNAIDLEGATSRFLPTLRAMADALALALSQQRHGKPTAG